MDEANKLCAVAVVDIPYGAEKWEGFKAEVLALKLVEPVKQGCEGFVGFWTQSTWVFGR